MQNSKKQYNIAIVDDHNLFRKGLIKLINMADKDNKYNVLFEAESGEDLQQKLAIKSLPDIILMDIDMPGMDGFETVEWINKYHPGISILVISMFESKEAILRMIRLGVKGYLSKDIEVTDMHAALESIASDEPYYSDVVTMIMAEAIKNNNFDNPGNQHANSLFSDLGEREREFLKLACTDLTYQQIADKMSLSVKTIDGYRESFFKKFNVKNRVGLAMYAVRNGLVKL